METSFFAASSVAVVVAWCCGTPQQYDKAAYREQGLSRAVLFRHISSCPEPRSKRYEESVSDFPSSS
jgi:hypothetical protein